ncbi:MAG: hypothetical protein KIT80_23360 [Chitinophagaceae bacterium]|nr:hypothetical protein [Chitinophagaceae bacterium]
MPKGSYINIDASNGESLVENYGSGNELVTKDSTQGLMKVGPYLQEARVKISALSGSIDIDDLAYDFGKPDTSLNSVKINDFGAIGNGVNDDTDAFNSAISYLSKRGGGRLDLEVGKTYLVSGGIEPISNLTISGAGSTIKLKTGATQGIFYYNSATTLTGFNLSDTILDGNNVVQNVIHITEPSPVAPDKTWSYSILTNVEIKNSGAIGLYCPIPGRIRLIGCYIHDNDIGLAWDREHIDAYGTTVESNRIGIRSTGNHFVWLHSTIAHNTEKGWTTSGAGLGTYSDVYEAGFIGCTFLDNGTIACEGEFDTCRFVGNRFLDCDTYISNAVQTVIQGNHFGDGATTCAIDAIGDDCLIQANYIENCAMGIRTSSGSRGINIVGNNLENITNECVFLTRPTRLSITDNVFKVSGIGVSGTVSGGDIGFSIDNNKFHIIGTRGVYLPIASGDVNDISISYNRFWDCGLEAIRLEGTGASIGSCINGNQITDANTDNVAGTHAIYTSRAHTGSSVCGNVIRNTTSGKADHAILFGAASVSDMLFDGNVARGMLGTAAYDLPSSATIGDNIGTFDA